MKKTIVSIACLINMSIINGQTSFCFQPKVDYATGAMFSNPETVITGDFNGDGKADLAATNTNFDNIAVLLGDGLGSFSAPQTYTTGSYPYGLTSGDFNGDGYIDLVSTNLNSNDISVLLGSATGTFSAASTYTVGVNPISVNAIDFNSDGNIDLAVANSNSSDISIMLGNGTGTFLTAINYTVGLYPYSVNSADFNSDGNIDLAVVVNGANSIAVLFGNGTGVFSAPVTYAVGANPNSVTSSDFNGDGYSDLAVTNVSSNNISVLLGSSIGTFAAAVTYTAGGISPWGIAATDLNGDGKKDIIATNGSSSSVSVYLGDGLGSFASALNYATGLAPYSLCSADFNGDSKPDMAISNSIKNNISVILSYKVIVTVSNQNVCMGSTTPLYPTGADFYSFSNGSNQITAYSDTIIKIVGINQDGCTSDTVSCLVSPNLASPTITNQSGSVHICEGANASFTVNSPGNNTYQWEWVQTSDPINTDSGFEGDNGDINYDTDSLTIIPITSANWGPDGFYAVYCIVTNSNNCSTNSQLDTIYINPLPIISATTNNTLLCTGQTSTLSVTGALSYTWNTGSNTNAIAVTPTTQTTYTVNGTDVNGCSNTTTIVQDVSLCTGINSSIVNQNSKILLYPNPTDGLINIELEMMNEEKTFIEISNTIGQVVFNEKLINPQSTINLPQLSSGIYFVKINSGNQQITKRLIVDK